MQNRTQNQLCKSKLMLSVTMNSIMLSIIMLNVIMLNINMLYVVAPWAQLTGHDPKMCWLMQNGYQLTKTKEKWLWMTRESWLKGNHRYLKWTTVLSLCMTKLELVAVCMVEIAFKLLKNKFKKFASFYALKHL